VRPYFALRSYQDNGEHYAHQLGSEPSPAEFLDVLWAATAEMARVLKPTGSAFINLGDKYAGSQPHNGWPKNCRDPASPQQSEAKDRASRAAKASDFGGVRAKSLLGLPWRYALGCIDHLGLILRAEVIWSKPNGLPESVTDRVRRSHEQWFHFTKEPRYYSAIDEIREGYHPGTAKRYESGYKPDNEAYAAGGPTKNGVLRHDGGGPSSTNPLGKLPGSVWSVPSEPLVVPEWVGVDHFAAFPQEWPRRLVLGWSPPGICTACGEGRRPVVDKKLVVLNETSWGAKFAGKKALHKHNRMGTEEPLGSTEATITGYACACDVPSAPTRPAVVLDPFAGTGTVPMVARALGRFGVGVDLSADYLRLAVWRVFRSGHGAKSVGRTNRDRQGDLFSGAL
jgi:DNA modification methylase